MEIFEAIVEGDYLLPVTCYLQALADMQEDMQEDAQDSPLLPVLPDVSAEVSLSCLSFSPEEQETLYMTLQSLGYSAKDLQSEVRVTALGLVCLLGEAEAIAEAILWHNVYYKLGLVRDMSVVSVGEGDNELQSIILILRVRELDYLADLQLKIYNNLPPF